MGFVGFEDIDLPTSFAFEPSSGGSGLDSVAKESGISIELELKFLRSDPQFSVVEFDDEQYLAVEP